MTLRSNRTTNVIAVAATILMGVYASVETCFMQRGIDVILAEYEREEQRNQLYEDRLRELEEVEKRLNYFKEKNRRLKEILRDNREIIPMNDQECGCEMAEKELRVLLGSEGVEIGCTYSGSRDDVVLAYLGLKIEYKCDEGVRIAKRLINNVRMLYVVEFGYYKSEDEKGGLGRCEMFGSIVVPYTYRNPKDIDCEWIRKLTSIGDIQKEWVPPSKELVVIHWITSIMRDLGQVRMGDIPR